VLPVGTPFFGLGLDYIEKLPLPTEGTLYFWNDIDGWESFLTSHFGFDEEATGFSRVGAGGGSTVWSCWFTRFLLKDIC